MDFHQQLFTRNYNDLRYLWLRGDVYSAIRASAILRLWLIESSSIIHVVNKDKIKILFEWADGAHPIGMLNVEYRNIMFHDQYMNGFKAKYIKDLRKGNLSEFLKLPAIWTEQKVYTIRAVIKFVANSMGAAHIASSSGMDKLDENYHLSKVPISVICLCIHMISSVVLDSGISEVRKKIISFPVTCPVKSNWIVSGNKAAYFNGKDQYMKAEIKDRNISPDFFGFAMSIKIFRQKYNSNRYICHFGGGQKSGFEFKMVVKAMQPFAIFKFNSRQKYIFPFYGDTAEYMGKWCCLAAFFIRYNKGIRILLSLDGPIVLDVIVPDCMINVNYNAINIGASIKGKHCCEMMYNEALFATGDGDLKHVDDIIRYITGSWQRVAHPGARVEPTELAARSHPGARVEPTELAARPRVPGSLSASGGLQCIRPIPSLGLSQRNLRRDPECVTSYPTSAVCDTFATAMMIGDDVRWPIGFGHAANSRPPGWGLNYL